MRNRMFCADCGVMLDLHVKGEIYARNPKEPNTDVLCRRCKDTSTQRKNYDWGDLRDASSRLIKAVGKCSPNCS